MGVVNKSLEPSKVIFEYQVSNIFHGEIERTNPGKVNVPKVW